LNCITLYFPLFAALLRTERRAELTAIAEFIPARQR
jgi:hypothetical protein